MRTTAAATEIVGVALLVGAFTVIGILRTSLTHNVTVAARLRAADIAALLRSGASPSSLAVGSQGDELIQVVDRTGTVLAASSNIQGEGPIATLAPGQAATVQHLPVGGGAAFSLVAVAAQTPQGTVTIISGRSLGPVAVAAGAVAGVLAAGLPALLLLVAGTTWMVVSRALGPVEVIRAEVAAISGADLARRVPVSSGGDEIARLAGTMNSMLDRLETSQARQRQFVSDASHELRSPIATIRMHSEILLAHPEGAKIEDFAHHVLAENLRLECIVADLVTLARADEHMLEPDLRQLDLDDIVFEEAQRLRRQGTSLAISTAEVGTGPVEGDRGQLRRMVRNLADNAARHALSRIVFKLEVEGGQVVLTVGDDGQGIPPDDRERIFERFARLDDARARQSGGTGLGLAIVREIVVAHGGTVTAGEDPSGGACLEVRLAARSA